MTSTAPDQVGKQASDELDAVARDYWRALMARHPTWATSLSVHEHDSELEDLSPESRATWRLLVEELLERLGEIDVGKLSAARRTTAGMLRHEMDSQALMASLDFEAWNVDQIAGPQVALLDLVRIHPVRDASSMTTFLARVRKMPRQIDQHAANLLGGLARGLVAPSTTLVRVIQQLDDAIAAGPAACSLVTATQARPESVPAPAHDEFRAELLAAVADGLLPALERLRIVLVERIRPAARTQPGLSAMPGGDEVYRMAIRIHVTLDRTPEELHETGRSEMKRIRAEMVALCDELFPGMSLAEAFSFIRSDKRFTFGTREEIVAAAEAAVHRATEAAKACFSLLPDHECAVKPIEAHAEKSAPAAYYIGPAPDGSRPGTYFINTHEPTSRTRHDAEVVAFHEAVPGHHLQIALTQGFRDVPEFQKHSHSTAFVEGWALYTERLADELGLYTGPMDRLGMFSCDAWRASRLVVDTGLHSLGWTREQAIAYMAENTTASLPEIENEVDRYTTWPGQALSYKMGQLEILALRRKAEQDLGARFDIKAFHRAILESGGVPLPVLRDHVEAWIASA